MGVHVQSRCWNICLIFWCHPLLQTTEFPTRARARNIHIVFTMSYPSAEMVSLWYYLSRELDNIFYTIQQVEYVLNKLHNEFGLLHLF
jgi:hypothetical protein